MHTQFGPGHQFTLETDASLEGLGAVLSQADVNGKLHPVAYASRALHKHERNYPITELLCPETQCQRLWLLLWRLCPQNIEEQYQDPDFKPIIDYLQKGVLPEDDKVARKIVLHNDNFDVIDGLLQHENPNFPGRWCVAIPKEKRADLIREAHDGRFSGHFAEKRIYELLRRR